MTATPIAATVRYFRPEKTKVYWLPAVANPTSPTRPELDAGTDLSDEVSDISGWSVTSDTVDTPDLGSRFVGKIPSTISADDSSLTFYADSSGQDVRGLLTRNQSGFIVWLDEGDTGDYYMDVFPVRVSSVPKVRDMSNAATITVNFTVTREPSENVTIPA
ncbi:hypothetical protein RVR_8320 [Actinacidiphila reveromycinica]|uniref:Uncharacterized protein n=1 Tax=Actinacidiphila reveromycinica TaxID=659352 RepID=A0A7U3VRR3_9ACTN|nr:hypothetical protein [Streptomyces sp. SN-593]BBB01076.1 hypothetical protein RVR_8320 [Streptomyces sp. SN-593]